MSIINEAERIKENIQNAYKALADRGAAIPEKQNSENLPAAIQSIPNESGGTKNLLLTPIYVHCSKNSSTTSSSSASSYIKVNIAGGKTLKISGRYSKQRGGCSLSLELNKSINVNNNTISLGTSVDGTYTISGITAATISEGSEYSHVFNLENADCDEIYIRACIIWKAASGTAYYGSAVLNIDEIVVS